MMGFLTWESSTGKILTIIMFLIILAVLMLAIMGMVPGMESISQMVQEMTGK